MMKSLFVVLLVCAAFFAILPGCKSQENGVDEVKRLTVISVEKKLYISDSEMVKYGDEEVALADLPERIQKDVTAAQNGLLTNLIYVYLEVDEDARFSLVQEVQNIVMETGGVPAIRKSRPKNPGLWDPPETPAANGSEKP